MKNAEFPIKERLVWVTDKKTGVRYQELRKYQYDPERKYNRQLSSERTGYKLMPGEDTPTRSRAIQRKKPGQADAASIAQETTGAVSATTAAAPDALVQAAQIPNAFDLLDHACTQSGLADALSHVYGKTAAEKILTVVHFMVLAGGPVSTIEDWQLEHDVPYREGLTADSCYELFDQLGQDAPAMQNLFRILNFKTDGQPLLAFDTRGLSPLSESGMALPYEAGYDKAGFVPDRRLLAFFSSGTELPVSFEAWNGISLSSVTEAVTRMKCGNEKKRITLVACSDLFSHENMCRLCRSHVGFIMQASMKDGWIKQQFEDSIATGRLQKSLQAQPADSSCPACSCKGVLAAAIPAMTNFSRDKKNDHCEKESEEFKIYCHYFISTADAASGKICAERTEVLLSNCEANPWKALECCLKRNKIETSCRCENSSYYDVKQRLYYNYTITGKELCHMIALGVIFFIQHEKNEVMQQCFEKAIEAGKYSQEERDAFCNLGEWLQESDVRHILIWYDCKKTIRVENKIGRQRWSQEKMARDRLFWKLLKA